MRTLVSSLCAAAMTMTALVTPTTYASAAPLALPRIEAGRSDVVQARYHGSHHHHFHRHHRFHHHGGRGHFYGHRGYRHYHHHGSRAAVGAFIAGAVIGSVLAAPPRRDVVVRRSGNAHVSYCYNRYRSYRASDNTFQPSYGPRRQCVSP